MEKLNEVALKIDITELRNIYFGDRKHNYFFGPNTKKQSFYFVLTLTIYPFFVYYTLQKEDSWFFMLGTIFFALLVYDFWKVAKPIMDWKRETNRFIEKASQVRDLRFSYNNSYFIHQQNQEIIKQEWQSIQEATISEQFIWIRTDVNILLPSKSMTEQEYNQLTDVILQQVPNVKRN